MGARGSASSARARRRRFPWRSTFLGGAGGGGVRPGFNGPGGRGGGGGEAPAIPVEFDILRRGRAEVLSLDLKRPEDAARVRGLAAEADGLIEGFRPGAMERLGLGPEVLCADNPRLVYGRLTGWGQTGP